MGLRMLHNNFAVFLIFLFYFSLFSLADPNDPRNYCPVYAESALLRRRRALILKVAVKESQREWHEDFVQDGGKTKIHRDGRIPITVSLAPRPE